MYNKFNSSASFDSTPIAGYSLADCGCSQYVSPDSSIADWSKPLTRCVAGDYSEICKHGVVYNKQTLTDDLWVELPACAKQFSMCGVYQIQPEPRDCEASAPVCSIRQRNIWLRIPTAFIDTSTGQKIYRIEFKHKCSLENMSLYFSYTVQDDNPAKPYVYMR